MVKDEKKVWIVSYNYGSVKAGPVIRFLRYTPHFIARGCNIRFIVPDRNEPNQEQVDVNFVRSDTINSFFRAVYKKAAIEKPDVLVFLSTEIYHTLRNYKMRLLGIKVIYINTMKLSFTHRGDGEKRVYWKILLLRMLSFFLYNSFSNIVNSTLTLQEDLKGKKKKQRIIYNGVDTEKFKPISVEEKVKLRRELDIPENVFVFLFIGLFVQRKGILDLMNGWLEFKKKFNTNTILLLVGNEKENASENDNNFIDDWTSIKKKLSSHSNNYDVIMKPFATNIDQYFKVANCFVFLSYLEGMPNVLLESMSTGLAVLTTEFDGFSNDYGINNKELIILKDRNVEIQCKNYHKIYTDSNYTSKIGENAREFAVKQFAIEKSINEYVKLFKDA